MAVGRRIYDSFGRDVAVGASAILGDEGLAQPLGQPLPDEACGDVDATTG